MTKYGRPIIISLDEQRSFVIRRRIRKAIGIAAITLAIVLIVLLFVALHHAYPTMDLGG